MEILKDENIDTVIFANQANEPALKVTANHIIGAWDDDELLQKFAEMCDVITLENEFVPVEILKRIEEELDLINILCIKKHKKTLNLQ